MKLIIAGSRTISLPPSQLDSILCASGIDPYYVSEIVCGEAKGVDYSGKRFCLVSRRILKSFPAKWENEDGEFDKAAGHKRNKEMAEYADALLLIWDGESKGSKNMLSEMKKLKKPVYEVILRKHNV